MRLARPRFASALATASAVVLAGWLLEPPRERIHRASGWAPFVAPTISAAAPLPVLASPTASPSDLAFRLARARVLAEDQDPLAESLLEQLIATAESEPEILERAREELTRFHAEAGRLARDAAGWLSLEAGALARDGSPAAVGRYAEAIAAARTADDAALVERLQREVLAVRQDLRSREVAERIDRIRGVGKVEDGSADEDVEIRKGFLALAGGDAGDALALVQRLLDRAEREHGSERCRLALADCARGRAAIERVVTLTRDDSPFREPLRRLGSRELRCRLEEGGRAIQRGDANTALERLDLADLVRLDRRASANIRVLYLLGRALEADGQPDRARNHYGAAIGTATWLAADAPLELFRWLARSRALSQPISIRSPGAGPEWRRLPRARFTLFHELQGSAGGLAARVEAARTKALGKLGFASPIRVEASKTVVFVFATEEHYRESGSAPRSWAGAHAASQTLEDGSASTIVVYAPGSNATFSLDDVLVHEWTHVLVGEHLRGEPLPSWAVEGVATWVAEPEHSPLFVHGAHQTDRFDWETALAARYDPRYTSSSGPVAYGFYAQSLLAFTTAVRRSGSATTVLAAARKLHSDPKEPFVALGFKDREDWENVLDQVIREGSGEAK